MIEGVFQVSELTARDIMVPRAQMDAVNIADAPETFIPYMQQTAHSRFPVYEGSRDNIIGILLAKDLLRYYTDDTFDLRENAAPGRVHPRVQAAQHPAARVPDQPQPHRHRRGRVRRRGGAGDDRGRAAEQIVGDIEDEFDLDEDHDNILPTADGALARARADRDRAVQRGLRHRLPR